MCGIVVFLKSGIASGIAPSIHKKRCVVVALKLSYYRITYRITVLPYYCITGSLVTTSYGLLQLVTVVIACYRLLPLLLPLVTACYSIMCYVLNDYYTSSRTGEYRGDGIVGQLLVDLVVAVGRSRWVVGRFSFRFAVCGDGCQFWRCNCRLSVWSVFWTVVKTTI